MASGFQPGSLVTYANELTGLGKEIFTAANTIDKKLVSIEYGAIGSSHVLNTFKKTAIPVAGGCNAFTATGGTSIAQSTLTLCEFEYPDEICIKELDRYFYSWYNQKNGYGGESLGDFEDTILEVITGKIHKHIDSMIWRAESNTPAYDSVTSDLTLCKGFLSAGYSNSASTAANLSKVAFTIDNAYNLMGGLVTTAATYASAILDKMYVYLSPADFQIYLQSYAATNKYNAVIIATEGLEMVHHPGSIGTYIVKTNGMDGAASGTYIATHPDNAVVVLPTADALKFDSWFSKDAGGKFRYKVEGKMGVGFRQPEFVIVSR